MRYGEESDFEIELLKAKRRLEKLSKDVEIVLPFNPSSFSGEDESVLGKLIVQALSRKRV